MTDQAVLDRLDGQSWRAWIQSPVREYDLAMVHFQGFRLRIFIACGANVCLAEEVIFTDATTGRNITTVQTDQGEYTIHKAYGCACGNPLASFLPNTWPD